MVLAGRALVVDDSRAIREAMTSMLGREGWIVDVAEDGARALQMTRQLSTTSSSPTSRCPSSAASS